jgi:hypothetical protein
MAKDHCHDKVKCPVCNAVLDLCLAGYLAVGLVFIMLLVQGLTGWRLIW